MQPLNPKARRILLRRLRRLINEHGAVRFLTGTLIEPSDSFFPEPWHPNEERVRHWLTRLLEHIGLSWLGFALRPLSSEQYIESRPTIRIKALKSVFDPWGPTKLLEVREDHFDCGVDFEALDSPVDVLASLARTATFVFMGRQALEGGYRETPRWAPPT